MAVRVLRVTAHWVLPLPPHPPPVPWEVGWRGFVELKGDTTQSADDEVAV